MAGTLDRRLEGRRLVFTVATGRCGTGHLARLLEGLPDVAAVHEPEPRFDRVMRDVQGRPERARRFWLEEKLPAIAARPEPVYVETSHLFGKGFAEPLLELGLVPDLVLLSRPHREVARSYAQLSTIPGRSEKGLRYLLGPEDPGVLPLPGWRELDDYQLCYWYCLEIERRREHYARLFAGRGGRVARLTLEELRTGAGLARLLKELDLPRPSLATRLRSLWTARSKTNTKRKRKTAEPPDRDFDALEREVRERVEVDRERPGPGAPSEGRTAIAAGAGP